MQSASVLFRPSQTRSWSAGFRMLALAAALLVPLSATHAVEPDEILPDAALEQRARGISAGLRCLVCQNQSIDDSSAPLARDLRLLVRERLKAGDSDKAVEAYVVARYGEFVLLRPPLTVGTLLLWLTPVALLISAALLMRRNFAGGKAAARADSEQALSAAEQRRLDEILKREA